VVTESPTGNLVNPVYPQPAYWSLGWFSDALTEPTLVGSQLFPGPNEGEYTEWEIWGYIDKYGFWTQYYQVVT
jgi:hypothetical protein